MVPVNDELAQGVQATTAGGSGISTSATNSAPSNAANNNAAAPAAPVREQQQQIDLNGPPIRELHADAVRINWFPRIPMRFL